MIVDAPEGIEFDVEANKKASRSESCFSKPGSKVQLWVVPTDEELAKYFATLPPVEE